MTTAVVRLGVGNTAAVMFALERLDAPAVLTDDARVIAEADRVILPGVGAAAYAMERIDACGLRGVLASFPRPLLGICLGQQILFDASEEGDAKGFGLLAGKVTHLPASPDAVCPHMGWSRLTPVSATPLLEGVSAGDYVYFVHSYVCPVSPDTAATATYGAPFAAVVTKGNIYGCQFHPERSGAVGARILENFLRAPC